MQWLNYKTPMLSAPQQPLNSNDKHFTVFAVVTRNQDALNFENTEPQNLLGQAVSEN
ncbi:hypothetical protein NB613_05060 [Vibrio parahaemolyticus]|uniref:hypothetical protein n=1 Tax=Vibrio parahaemolyticus TaxID=670 RepID=UPI00215B83FA|nr:hypothetical protein [Vibrio parahaemolyticus]MCR9851390.1 hypothetical protein [Vibrio parahaemolyticus]HCM0868012.1 hypothetical protein [Vibrio parahaemolyticus]